MNAQKTLLGCIVLDRSVRDMVIPLLKKEYFSLKYRPVADAIISMYKSNRDIDLITLTETLGIDHAHTIAQLTNDIGTTHHVMSYFKIVRDDFVRYKLSEMTCEKIEEDPDDYISDYISRLEELRGEALEEYKDLASVILENEQPEEAGIPVELSKLNKLDPFKPGRLVVLAARPSHGKTNLGLDITRCACSRGRSVLFFSLEMTINELVKRLTTNTCPEEVSSWNLRILDKAGVGVDYIKAHSRIMKPDLIVIDYLGLIKLPYGEKRTYQIGEITKEIKNLAKELNCPILLIAQANREIEGRSPKLHQMNDLADSADIERDADMIMFTMRYELWNIPEYNDGSPTGGTNVVQIVKNRHGDVDMFVAERDVFIFKDYEPFL